MQFTLILIVICKNFFWIFILLMFGTIEVIFLQVLFLHCFFGVFEIGERWLWWLMVEGRKKEEEEGGVT